MLEGIKNSLLFSNVTISNFILTKRIYLVKFGNMNIWFKGIINTEPNSTLFLGPMGSKLTIANKDI